MMREVMEPNVGPGGALGARLVMLGEPNGAVAEAYRELRTNLRFDPHAGEGAGGQVYLLADAGGVNDRAAVVANLGVACALAGARVIVVDADLRGAADAGSLSALFGQESATEGIATAILGPDEEHRTIVLPVVETGVANLLLLPAGGHGRPPGRTNPADLLGADAFGVLLAALRAQADVVLIDAPPVADVADSRAIAARVDGVLLLVAQGKTRRPQAQRALAALEQVGATVLGVVLTET
ncbi:MAG: CpsD/CapB family tyrosine-protein kinase [Thermomicrobia bacterium]|nr:CpsD/CapB family tyrosine-protein kinase [Thermomicrobia bacterium]MCA1723464.1 CpsD/CapB family tyrosine-protein kinase [Thermomicrobia bacterium]